MRGFLLLCVFGTVGAKYGWNGPGEPTAAPSENECLTDPAACGCCLMKKQMTRMEQYFNMSLDELESRLNMAKNALNNIRSSRSAFSAALMDDRRCIGPYRSGRTVKYEEVLLNLGNNYNSTTGVFTVPRSGVYSLALTVYSDSGADNSMLQSCANLRVNNEDVSEVHDMNNEDQEDSATIAIVRQLSSGDSVSIYLPPGCSLCDNMSHYNTFSGFLLYATD